MVDPADMSDAVRDFAPFSPFRSAVAAGVGVMLIFAGIVLATQEALPEFYGFGLFLGPWLCVLAMGALALTLYASSLCCRTQRCRVVFTFAVVAVVAFEV